MGNSNQAFDNGYRVMSGVSTQATEYKRYQGAVYEPFNNTPPSESGESENATTGISGRKNLAGGGDPGTQGGSPVGEPFVLLLFAAVAAIFVAKRKKEPTPALPKEKE